MTAPRLTCETLAAWLLAAAAFTFPLLAVIAPLGITVELVILGVGCLPFVVQVRAWRRLPASALILLAALVAWTLASELWAEDAVQAASASFRLAGEILLGLSAIAAGLALTTAAAFDRLRLGLLAGFGLVAVSLLVLAVAGDLIAGLTREATGLTVTHSVKRGIAVLALLIWPARIALRHRVPVPAQLLLSAIIVAVIGLGHGSTAKIATGVGIVVALVVLAAPRRGPAVAGMALILVSLGMPLAAYCLPSPHETFQNWTFLPNSAHHRVTIWGFTGQRIAERPLLGWGMNASRSIPGGDDEVVVRRYDADGRAVTELTEAMLPLHPHNAVLQLWLELGGGGALALCAFIVWFISRIVRAPVAERGDLTALVATTFITAAASFGFWQGWWQASMWLIAVVTILALRRDDEAKTPDESGPTELHESPRS